MLILLNRGMLILMLILESRFWWVALSRDLRERIVAAIRDGSSMRGAAARFSVSVLGDQQEGARTPLGPTHPYL